MLTIVLNYLLLAIQFFPVCKCLSEAILCTIVLRFVKQKNNMKILLRDQNN